MRPGGRILALVAVLMSLAACGSRPEASPRPEPVAQPISLVAPTSAEPSCATGLRFTTVFTNAATGLRVMSIEMLNCGTEPVELNGYPQVKLFDEQWHQLAVEIVDGSGGIASVDGFDDAPQPITVQPGERAKSAFLWRNTNTSIDPPLVGSHVDMALAPDSAWQTLLPVSPEKGILIDLGSTGRMGVRAWYR
ncbi:DUF4232 domain-containing protein [Lentzea sp. BCCO 10_0856]|uniref:DUF4232 domain-containing protein n=1 Tax=Lentzea miocenica TaxID=3095431 RepID=A0ABU4TCI0_9PSEU|nr:DUF4232 domain-containing protein [Lentzea sp. BCCO 10_0856]MDX8035894.1 DUF4232 domain-containing protein [Lentzea sp. BCCO 10_0856]